MTHCKGISSSPLFDCRFYFLAIMKVLRIFLLGIISTNLGTFFDYYGIFEFYLAFFLYLVLHFLSI